MVGKTKDCEREIKRSRRGFARASLCSSLLFNAPSHPATRLKRKNLRLPSPPSPSPDPSPSPPGGNCPSPPPPLPLAVEGCCSATRVVEVEVVAGVAAKDDVTATTASEALSIAAESPDGTGDDNASTRMEVGLRRRRAALQRGTRQREEDFAEIDEIDADVDVSPPLAAPATECCCWQMSTAIFFVKSSTMCSDQFLLVDEFAAAATTTEGSLAAASAKAFRDRSSAFTAPDLLDFAALVSPGCPQGLSQSLPPVVLRTAATASERRMGGTGARGSGGRGRAEREN